MESVKRVSQERHFAIVPTWVIYAADLKPSDVRVYATLSERAGTKRRSWPGIRRIAADTHMAKSTVTSAVARLEAFGAIEIDRTIGRSNTYWLPKDRTEIQDSAVPEIGTPRTDSQDTTVPEIGTELDQPTTPTKLQRDAFWKFNTDRALKEAANRAAQGYQVRSPAALAQTIAIDQRFITESERIWGHRECRHCDDRAMNETYAPGSGTVAIPCERKPKK